MATPGLSKKQLKINEIIKTYISYKGSKYKVLSYNDFEKNKNVLDKDMDHIIDIYNYLKKDKTNNKKFRSMKDLFDFRSYLDKIKKIQDNEREKYLTQTVITSSKLNEFISTYTDPKALFFAKNIQKFTNNDFENLDTTSTAHYRNGIINAIKDIFHIDNKQYVEKLLHSDYVLTDKTIYKKKVKDICEYYKYIESVSEYITKKHINWNKLDNKQKQTTINSYTLRNKQIIKSKQNLIDFNHFLKNYGLNQCKRAMQDKLLEADFPKINEEIATYIISKLIKL